MSTNGKRRKWSAADKLRIVLAGMQPNVEVSNLCRRGGSAHPVLRLEEAVAVIVAELDGVQALINAVSRCRSLLGQPRDG